MLRPLSIIAGLLVLGLLAFLLLQQHAAAPPSTPNDDSIVRPEDRRSDLVSPLERPARDEAGVRAAPDARYVSIVGELTREEDGSPVAGAVATFSYRYLSKGPDAELRKVPVDVDEHGQFEQVFSEPVQAISCLIEPVAIETPGLQFDSLRRADFLRVEQPLDVRVDARGVRVGLRVSAGLEIVGRVYDKHTNDSLVDVLVCVRVDFGLTLGARTNSSGIFRLRGVPPVLAEPGRDHVAFGKGGPDFFTSIPKLEVTARAASHRPGSTVVPLPLSGSRPTHVDFALGSGIRVAGKVLDFSGRPVLKARVDVTVPVVPGSEDPSEALRLQATLTDEEGRFEFDGIELVEGCEIRAQHPWQTGPIAHVALGSKRQDRPGLVLTLPDTQAYRIRVRETNGALLDAHEFSVTLRDSWGERVVESTESVPSLIVWAAVGARTGLTVSVRRWENDVEIIRRARTVLEPLVQAAEPETVTLDLEQ